MADSFGISQVVNYLAQMGLQIASIDPEQEIVELAFHGNHGQWRLMVSFQQSGQARKLVLVVPHIGTVTRKKRLSCLEALLAVNYRIALGKFGLDLDDGEVRLEESVPLANDGITFEQFQLGLRAIVQTVAMYHSLIPRILYGNLSAQAALQACEEEFFQEEGLLAPDIDDDDEEDDDEEDDDAVVDDDVIAEDEMTASKASVETELPTELTIQDVMDEVTRLLRERKES